MWGSEERVNILVAFGVGVAGTVLSFPVSPFGFFVGWCKALKRLLKLNVRYSRAHYPSDGSFRIVRAWVVDE